MSQYKSFVAIIALCLLAGSARSAPTESDASTTAAPAASTAAPTTQAPTSAAPAASTAAPSDATTAAMAATTSGSASTTTVSAPSEASPTASMAVSSAQDMAHVANTTFTCYDRKVGYYADTEADCKVYHFCMLGDYNGQEVYQRISYLCLNETKFDQQGLDCVEESKMTAPCADSAKYYEDSNTVLRKAMMGAPTADKQ